MTIHLQIAGLTIRLHGPEDYPCLSWPLSPFNFFLAPFDVPADLEVSVAVVQALPDLPHGPLHFDACHGLWKLFETGSGFVLESADTLTLQPRSRSLISDDFSRISAWVLEQEMEGTRGWVPMHLFNPLVEICLVTTLVRRGGLLLHSAGVLTERRGFVFTGSSGAGKSTLSDFFAARGATVLSDERTIIRKRADRFVIYGTPWVGSSYHARNEAGPLSQLYCIRHGRSRHQIEPMSSSILFQFLLRQSFLPHWDRTALEATLTFITDLIEHVDCVGLAFVKNPDVVDYLEARDLSPSLVSP